MTHPPQMNDIIRIHDLRFRPYLTPERLAKRVTGMGQEIRRDYADRQPYFLVMLKGAFIFAADLLRAVDLPIELGFVRVSSYSGTSTTRKVNVLVPPDPEEIRGRDVILVEDIVDSGNTLYHFLPELEKASPASLTVATLLYKPDAVEHDVPMEYIGFEIPDKFVVGYGLDYDGQGRQLAGIYQVAEE